MKQSSQSIRNRSSILGSQRTNGLNWVALCEFETVDEAEKFVKNQLPSNATRTSRHPNCTFDDPLNILNHKLLEQIRRCQWNEDCNVQFRFRKCFTCDQAEICQAYDHPINAGQEFEKCNRGIEPEVKGLIEEYYKKNIRQVRPIDIFNWLNL